MVERPSWQRLVRHTVPRWPQGADRGAHSTIPVLPPNALGHPQQVLVLHALTLIGLHRRRKGPKGLKGSRAVRHLVAIHFIERYAGRSQIQHNWGGLGWGGELR